MNELTIKDMQEINGGVDAGLIAGGVVTAIGGFVTGGPVGGAIGLYAGAVMIGAAFGD